MVYCLSCRRLLPEKLWRSSFCPLLFVRFMCQFGAMLARKMKGHKRGDERQIANRLHQKVASCANVFTETLSCTIKIFPNVPVAQRKIPLSENILSRCDTVRFLPTVQLQQPAVQPDKSIETSGGRDLGENLWRFPFNKNFGNSFCRMKRSLPRSCFHGIRSSPHPIRWERKFPTGISGR